MVRIRKDRKVNGSKGTEGSKHTSYDRNINNMNLRRKIL